jgi:3-hydroxybutyryl-CoA dehydrogenase
MEIKKIGIVGSGAMGTGIAYAIAQNDMNAKIYWRSGATRDRSIAFINESRAKAVAKGKMTQPESDELLSKIEYIHEMEKFKDCQLVIESVIEKEDIKKDILNQLSEILTRDAIIATNTSSMSITALSRAVSEPERFIGMHFFNPVYAMKLVEIIRGLHTSDDTVEIIGDMVEKMSKTPVVVQRDTPGFIVNRLFMAQVREAIKILEEGIANVRDIDTALELGLNHPMGPFRLMDATGVDIAYYVLDHFRQEMGDAYLPPQLLKRMVEGGYLGKKSGRGFYDYYD